MKQVTYLGLVLIVGLTILGAACNQTATNSNSAMNHGGMNHNSMMNNNSSMNMSGMNQNSMPMNSNMPMNHSGMKSDANAASAPYDLQFIDTMTAHHTGAVEMAKMIDGKTQNAEIIKFGKQIIADQEKEIGQMKDWREKWFKGAPKAMNMEMPGMMDSMKMDMSKLSNSKDKGFRFGIYRNDDSASRRSGYDGERSLTEKRKTGNQNARRKHYQSAGSRDKNDERVEGKMVEVKS